MSAVTKEPVNGGIVNSTTGARDLGKESRIPVSCGGVRSRSGQCLEVSLHLLPKWRRYVYNYLKVTILEFET